MDRQEAFNIFIKRNSGTFGLDPFPFDAFKKTKREFFLNFAKLQVPRDGELASEVLEWLIKSAQIRTTEELEKWLALPFFRTNIQRKDYFYQRIEIKLAQSDLPIDVSKIEDAQYAQKIEEQMEAKIRYQMTLGPTESAFR